PGAPWTKLSQPVPPGPTAAIQALPDGSPEAASGRHQSLLEIDEWAAPADTEKSPIRRPVLPWPALPLLSQSEEISDASPGSLEHIGRTFGRLRSVPVCGHLSHKARPPGFLPIF